MLTIYSKSSCPSCIAAETLCKNYDIPYKLIKIDEDAAAKMFILGQGHRTVPQIYCNDYLFTDGWPSLMRMSKDDIETKMRLFKEKK